MVNNNGIPIEVNKKPFETVYELKDEYKIPSFEEFMKDYEADEKINESYENEIRGYGSIGVGKGYGPMYQRRESYEVSKSENGTFSIKYKFDHSSGNWKNYFEQSGNYNNVWSISGSIWDIKDEQWKLEDGEIRVVVVNTNGGYERNIKKEEEVKDQLRKDVRKFELWSCGNPGRIEREFKDMMIVNQITTRPIVYACPTKTLEYVRSRK